MTRQKRKPPATAPQTGPRPDPLSPDADPAADEDSYADFVSEQSFPASDPPPQRRETGTPAQQD